MTRSFRSSCGALLLVAATPLVACGNAALRAAEHGDDAKLRVEIAYAHERGKLSNEAAAGLARAVAERAIATANDEASALARLRDVRACAAELDDALEARMKTRDGAGAEAALSRVEDGRLGAGDARAWLDDPDDRWRAVGARALHRSEDRARRHAAMVDPSPRVRSSAIRAAAQAKEGADLDLLFEAARIDPEPLLRNVAIRSISAVLRGLGDRARGRAASDAAVRLRDVWTSGDDAVKEDVAVAWGLAPVFEAGGREALRVIVSSASGPGAIAAAGVVMRSAADDPELVGSAAAHLARTIADGSRRDRSHALAVARFDERVRDHAGVVLEAIREASHDDDPEVRVAALARLLESAPDRAAANEALVAIAGHGVEGFPSRADGARAREQAMRAKSVLAAAGDVRIQAWLERDLTSPEPRQRTTAASALAALGRSARAAPLLVDPDPAVRTRAACTMLVAARR